MLKTLDSFFKISSEQKTLLKNYVFEIRKNQEKINLIGKSTLNHIWVRHIMDSMQIMRYLPTENSGKLLLDVGTGAGFPGVVLFIMGRRNVMLCDKSLKKGHFLKKILKECSLDIKVYNNRIESYFKNNIEVIVSRAFASLIKLLNSIYHLITQETVLVVHKGKKHIQEIEEAKLLFAFKFEKFQSITCHEGVILRIKNIRKK